MGETPNARKRSSVRGVFIWGGAWLLTAFVHAFGFVKCANSTPVPLCKYGWPSLRPPWN